MGTADSLVKPHDAHSGYRQDMHDLMHGIGNTGAGDGIWQMLGNRVQPDIDESGWVGRY